MRQSITRFLLLSGLAPLLAFGGTTQSWFGPQDVNGNLCDPYTQSHCVIGDPLDFNIFSASLTGPMAPGGTWNLTILTNYGTNIPAGSVSIPEYAYDNASFGMADFMITDGTNFYAIIMSDHDGYAAGNLYKADGFQTSGAVMGAKGVLSPRPNLPALLNPGGTLIGTGVLNVQSTGGDGVSEALYRISVDFVAPVNFLQNTKFTIYASSYVCDNGWITGEGDPFIGPDIPPDPDNPVPEPSTWMMLLPAAIGGFALRRKLA